MWFGIDLSQCSSAPYTDLMSESFLVVEILEQIVMALCRRRKAVHRFSECANCNPK
jgi:hypothetical protein